MDTFSIAREIGQSIKWNGLASVARYGLLLISLIVLARFLTPSEYGIAAIAGSLTAFFTVLSQVGFAQAIIGIKDVDKRLLDSLFSASLLIALVLYVSLVSITPYLALLYDSPLLASMLTVTGLGLFVALGSALPTAVIQRSLDYRGQAMVVVVTSLVSGIGAITMAISGSGVWALIVPALLGGLAGGITAFAISGYRPSWVWDVCRLRATMNFGASALISNLANFVCNNLVVLLMGKAWTPAVLGLYAFADSKHAKIFDFISGQLAGSVFPILSKVSDDLPRIRNAYLTLIRLSLYIVLPSYGILILGAPILFPVLFGEKWNGAILPFQILCIMPMARAFGIVSNPVLYALRYPHLSARVAVGRMVAYSVIVVACLLYKANIILVALAVVLADAAAVSAYAWVCLSTLKCSIREYASVALAPTATTAVMLSLLMGARYAVETTTGSSVLGFAAALLLAVLAYTVMGYWQLQHEWSAIRVQLRR